MTITPHLTVPTAAWRDAVLARFWISTNAIDRNLQAIALRNQGHTYQEIADRLGYAHRMSAYKAVNHSAAAHFLRGNGHQMAQEARNVADSMDSERDAA